MKVWALLGIALLAAGIIQLLILADGPGSRSTVESFLVELSGRLEKYADVHQGRYPESLEELDATGFANRSAEARDPWGRFYVYERHPSNARNCRIYTLGSDGEPSVRRDPDEVVHYRIEGRSFWKHAFSDVPREW